MIDEKDSIMVSLHMFNDGKKEAYKECLDEFRNTVILDDYEDWLQSKVEEQKNAG